MDLYAPTPPNPRLRVLPVYCAREGEPTHYLILDRAGRELTGEFAADSVDRALKDRSIHMLVFADEIDLPDAGGEQ